MDNDTQMQTVPTDAKTLTTTSNAWAGLVQQSTGAWQYILGRRILNVAVDVTNVSVVVIQMLYQNIQVGTLLDPDAYVPNPPNDLSDVVHLNT